VNFVDQADAIRAKDDVLNRLGGNIGMPNGQTVRIGFGKADSAPAAPGKAAAQTSVGKAGTGAGTPNGLGGMEAQLQSTPTRALWIGSIPSTTTPATILSVFSPYGPIESARVLTHKNCGFINFERLDDAVRARKALNGRDVLGPDVGAIRIGFAKVPVKGGIEPGGEEPPSLSVQGVGDLSVGATIHALRSVKGASTVPVDQQVLGGAVENYRSNLLLSLISAGTHTTAYVSDGAAKPAGWTPSVTEQQMIMKELAAGAPEADADIAALAGASSSIFACCDGWLADGVHARLPPADDVLLDDPARVRAAAQPALGREQAARAPEAHGRGPGWR
jgi:protein JSN1